MENSALGVVVIGVGIAGRVRIRDLLTAARFEECQLVNLVGYISRRKLDIEGATQMNLEDALGHQGVHICIICTENERHETLARQCLEAGKHTLVEFPLARSAPTARDLYSLAEKQNVVLYEEDISLLTDSFQELLKLVAEKSPLTVGKSTLEGRFNGWIEDFEKSGSPFHSSVSQLHSLVAVWPDLETVSARVVHKKSFRGAYAKLRTGNGLIDLSIEREVLDTPKRSIGFKFEFEDGSVLDSNAMSSSHTPPAPGKPGLFLKDFIQFLSIVRGQLSGASQRELTIKCLELADQLYQMAKENDQSEFEELN